MLRMKTTPRGRPRSRGRRCHPVRWVKQLPNNGFTVAFCVWLACSCAAFVVGVLLLLGGELAAAALVFPAVAGSAAGWATGRRRSRRG